MLSSLTSGWVGTGMIHVVGKIWSQVRSVTIQCWLNVYPVFSLGRLNVTYTCHLFLSQRGETSILAVLGFLKTMSPYLGRFPKATEDF